MHILTTSTGTQSLKFVSRADASAPTLSLTDKSKRTTATVSVTKSDDGDYMVLSGTFSLNEGTQHSFVVKDGSTEIYRGLIFCTDQTDLDKYFINKDEYVTQDNYDNDFVII
jgi:CCR4-NOT transcriptional regulation complex NOT5 subunit